MKFTVLLYIFAVMPANAIECEWWQTYVSAHQVKKHERNDSHISAHSRKEHCRENQISKKRYLF